MGTNCAKPTRMNPCTRLIAFLMTVAEREREKTGEREGGEVEEEEQKRGALGLRLPISEAMFV